MGNKYRPVQALTAATPEGSDILAFVKDPDGTPLDRKVTFDDLADVVGGGGGGSSVVLATTVTLDNDEIKNLSTPGGSVELLAAAGAKNAYCLHVVICTLDPSAGAYSFSGSAATTISAAGSGTIIGASMVEESAESWPMFSNGSTDIITMSLGPRFTRGGDGSEVNDMLNKSVVIAITGVDGNAALSGGHANNTLRVTLIYSTVQLRA